MSKKIWWMTGGMVALAVAGIAATMATLRTEAPDEMQDAAQETPGVLEAYAFRESNLLGLAKTAGVNLVVAGDDTEEAERVVRETFANVEQAMLAHGYDTLTITARTESGGSVIEATNVDGPLSVIQLPVPSDEAPGLVAQPVETLDEHLENVVLAV